MSTKMENISTKTPQANPTDRSTSTSIGNGIPESQLYIYTLLYVLIVVIIIAGNLMAVLVVTKRNKTWRRVYHVKQYLGSLSVADMLTGVYVLIHIIPIFLKRKSQSSDSVACVLGHMAGMMFGCITANHQLVIAFDRLVAALYPVAYSMHSNKVQIGYVASIAIWVLSILETVVVYFGYGIMFSSKRDLGNNHGCHIAAIFGQNILKYVLYSLIRFLIWHTLSALCYFVVYGVLRRRLRQVVPEDSEVSNTTLSQRVATSRSSSGIHKQSCDCEASTSMSVPCPNVVNIQSLQALNRESGKNLKKISRQSWKVTKTVLVTTIAQTVCYLPSELYFFIRVASPETDVPSAYVTIAMTMVILNSAVNPFIYHKFLPHFSETWTEFRKCSKNNRNNND